ncbi:MAG TPA: hypothetical protein VGH74_12185 [Planctomycetaceae bacterium]|jgi:hypothetical protein
MPAVRIPKHHWGKAWRAMIEIAPVRLVADDPIYEVLPAHVELLAAQGVAYEVVRPGSKRKQGPRRASSH